MKTKQRTSPKTEHFFSPNLSGDLRSDARRSQIIGGDADEDHTQIIGGYTDKLLGEIYPPIPPGFGTSVPAGRQLFRIACLSSRFSGGSCLGFRADSLLAR